MICHGWNIKAAAPGKRLHLVRSDGSSSGLCLNDRGQLQRTTKKPDGKAERKRIKRIRAALRREQSVTAQAA